MKFPIIRLLPVFIILLLSSTIYKANAQGYMLAINSTVPNELTVCGTPRPFTLNVYNPSPNLLTNITLTVNMPAGMRYTAGSISGASELNITNLSAPQFSLNNLATLTTANLALTASPGCDIISYLAAGSPTQNNILVEYFANGNPSFDQHTTFTYLIKQPNLSITTVSNQSYSGNVGDVFTRCITITNGGLGELSTFELTDEHGTGIEIVSVDKGTRTTSGNTETIVLTAADFVSAGNGNGFLESGESITICETVRVNNCISVASAFTAAWGCNNQVCQTSSSSANVVFPNLTPNLVVTHQPTQQACYGMNYANQQQLTIHNTGVGQAVNVDIEVYQSTGSTFVAGMTSAIDPNSFTIQIGAGAPTPIAATVLGNNANYSCLGGLRPGRLSVNIPAINGSETVYLRWNTYSCCHDYCSGTSPHAGTNNGWAYKGSYSNVCQNNYIIPDTYARGYSQLYADLTNNSSPSTIVSGQTLTYSFLFSNDINNYTSTAGRQWRFVVTMPNCVSFAGNARIVAYNGTSVWNPATVTTAGNTATITFTGNQPFNRVNGDLRFDLTANCGGCVGGPGTLSVSSSFISDPTCACVHNVSCVSLPMNVVCPVTCPGMTNTGFSISRTSYGLRDDNNDGVPEPGAVNLSLIRTDRAMFGDTVTSVYSGTVSGGSFPHLYAQSSITNGNNYLQFTDGVLTIARGGTTYTCNINTATLTNAGGIRTFNFDLSAAVLIASGCVPAGFTFQNGDVVQFRPKYRVSVNTGGAILNCEVTNEFYVSNIPNPINAGDKLYCNNYTGSFTIIGYYYTNWGPNSFNTSSCTDITVSQNYYLSIGPCCQQYAGGNLFPFEYRLWAWPELLRVIIPDGYTYVSAQFNHVRTAGNQAVQATAWQNVTPLNPNSTTLDFQVAQYFSRQGGAFMESDDGFYGTMQVTMRPSCAVVPNVATPVIYDWTFGESTNLQGSNTSNNFIVSTHDYVTYQGPKLFVQSQLPSILAQDNTASWDVSLSNITSVLAHNVWVGGPQVSGVSIIEVFDVTNNTLLTPTAGGIYQLGQLAGSTQRDLRITASYTSCSPDTIIIHAGWNCDTYPVDVVSYPCISEKIKLTLSPQIPTLIAQVTSPAVSVDLCDTASYTVEGINIQLGTAYDLKLRIVLPQGVSIISGSPLLSYPSGVPFNAIPDPVLISGSTYEWDISALNNTLGTDGLKGILQNTLNAVKIRFRVRTNCDYISGSLIGFNFNGRSACGLYTGQEVTLSSQLAITGADKPYETEIDLISTYISPCTNSTLMTVNILNNGPLATGPSDSVVVVLPEGTSLINGTYTGIINAPQANTFRTYMFNNRQHVMWRLAQGIQAGDSLRFSFEFAADAFALSCNIQNFDAFTVSAKNLLCVLNGVQCDVNVRTGDTILPMYVYKGNISFTSLNATATQNGTIGETLNVDLSMLNIGENVAQGYETVISFYNDADGNGSLSAADVLLQRDTITQNINNGIPYNHNTTLNVAAGQGCNLLAALETINNGCVCNPAQIFTNNIPLLNAGNDQEFCSGDTIQLGGQPLNGYQYSWLPVQGLQNTNSYTTNLTLENLSGANNIIPYILSTNRINCTTADTLMVTVFPKTNVSFAGLAVTYCSNDAVALLNGTPANGIFSGSGISGNNFNPALPLAGLHDITYTFTDANNCTYADTQQTTIFPAPVVSFTGLLPAYCEDANVVTLSGLPANGIFSGSGIVGNNFHPQNAGIGSHSIIYTYTDANQCSDADTQSVTINSLPVVSFTGLSAEYCVNYPLAILTGTPAGGVFSGAGISGNNFQPNIANAGTYDIVYFFSDNNQCADAYTQTVVVHPLTPVSFVGLNAAYCIDAPAANLLGNPLGGIFSGNGINQDVFTPAGAAAGNHDIIYTFTDNNNCVNADTQQVIVNALPVIAFTGLDTAYCVDASIVTLAGNIPAGTFDGAGIAGSRFIPTVAGAGTHVIIFSFTDFNGCFNADTQHTNVYDLPIVSISGLNTNYCSNDALVTLSGNPVGGNFSGTGITGNNFSPEIATAGFHILTYTFTDNNNCTNSISENTTVYAAPTVQEEIENISCYNAADGTITLASLDGTGPFNYNWNNGNYTTQNISGLSPGNYTIVIDDAMNCTFTATYTVTEPDLLVSSVITENAVCYLDENGSAVFTVNGGVSPYSFNWNNGLNVAENYSLSAGNYSVLITDANGCTNSHQFSIAQNEPVTLSVFPEIDTVAFGNEVQTIGEYYSDQMPVSFDWQPTEGLSCTDCAAPIASPLETTLYIVTMTDADGCMATEEIWVVVKDKKVFYVPNIFSPNGDGINDNFEIFVKGAKKFHLRVFDRWGEKVFEAEDVAQVWDGTRNGKLLSEGVYVFEVFLIYKDNTSLKHKGSVTLVR